MNHAIRIRDHLVLAGIVSMALVTGFSIYHAASVHNESQTLREQNAALSRSLIKLHGAFTQLQSYSETVQHVSIGGLNSLSHADEMHTGAALESASGWQFGLAARDLRRSLADRVMSDTEQFVRNMRQIDDMSDEIDLVTKRLGNISAALRLNKESLKAIPSKLPVWGRISSDYGERLSPFHAQRRMHEGIDILAVVGTSVRAPADGVVTFAGEYPNIGRVVVIDHGGAEILTRYGHLSAIAVRVGDKVKRDQVIAKTGNSGRSTGPHLHYEVWVRNQPADPREFLFEMTDQAPFVMAPSTHLSAEGPRGNVKAVFQDSL